MMDDSDLSKLGPITDCEFDTAMEHLVQQVTQVCVQLNCLARRASGTKQLPALRRGMVRLRGAVAVISRTVTFMAPPSEEEAPSLRQQAKTESFKAAWGMPPQPRVHDMRELMELSRSEHGILRIRDALRMHGVKMTDIVRLDRYSRVRLLLHMQAYGKNSEYHTKGLTPALRESLSWEHPLETEPALMTRWPDVASDYVVSDIELTRQFHAFSEHFTGMGIDFSYVKERERELDFQNRYAFDPRTVDPKVIEAAKKLKETWPEMRLFVENQVPEGLKVKYPVETLGSCTGRVVGGPNLTPANGASGFSRAMLEAWTHSKDFEERKKIINTLHDTFEVRMADIVKMSAEERVNGILALQAGTVTAETVYLRTPAITYHDAPPTLQDLKALRGLLDSPRLRVKQTVVRQLELSVTPAASSRGLGWCAKHVTGYTGYCKDCYPEGDPALKRRVCAYCGKLAQGEFAIHRDGFGEGPEVDLCNTCGDCDETVLSCETIWEKFAKDGACQ
jgi:hypothetical protein